MGDLRAPRPCERSGLHNCGPLDRWANHDASHDPCMCCGTDRLDPAPEQCAQPRGHRTPPSPDSFRS